MLEHIKDFFLLLLSSTGEVLSFGLKALIVVIAFALCTRIVSKIKPASDKKKLKVENLKEKQEKYQDQFYTAILDKKELKKYWQDKEKNTAKKSWKERLFGKKKELRQSAKKDSEQTLETHPEAPLKSNIKPSLFVLSFEGDIMATEVRNLREEISLVLNLVKPKDEILLLLESRGGSVAHYGLAANQLQRIRDHKIPLTICVDRVAGSGGYLMACVANEILAAPFAFIGSIGVLAGIPNIHEWLKKHRVSYEEYTAGKFKRTITPFGEITEEKKERLQEQLNLIHIQFKNFISKYRKINMEEVATGEAWLAEEALKKGLVDGLKCSDDYIREKMKTHELYQIRLSKEKNPLEKWMDRKKSLSNDILEDFTRQDFFI